MSSELEVKDTTVPAVEYLGDASDPRSLHSLLPKNVVNASMRITRESLEKSDRDLLQGFPNAARKDLSRLRESMWLQIHNASANGRKVNEHSCYYGVTCKAVFMKHLQHEDRVAFLLRPPNNYEIFMKEALTFSVEQIRDILEQDHIHPKTGMLDAKIADVKRRLFVDIADRVKGMPVQRTENLNVNKDIGPHAAFTDALPSDSSSLESIEKKIKALEKDMGSTRNVTPDEE